MLKRALYKRIRVDFRVINDVRSQIPPIDARVSKDSNNKIFKGHFARGLTMFCLNSSDTHLNMETSRVGKEIAFKKLTFGVHKTTDPTA